MTDRRLHGIARHHEMRKENSGSKSGQLVALVEQRAGFTASIKVSDKETVTVAAAFVDPLSRRSLLERLRLRSRASHLRALHSRVEWPVPGGA
jgi:hypothetical protein